MNRKELTGVLLATLCAIIWGSSFVFSAVLSDKMDPVVFAIIRYGLASIGLAVIFAFSKKKIWLNLKDAPVMAISGIIAQAVFFYTSLLALQYISASEVGVINGMIPIFTLLVSVVVYRRLPTPIQAIAVALSFSGAYFIASDPGNKFQGLNVGHLYMVIGVLGFVVSTFINKRLGDRYDGLSTMMYQFIFATLALLAVMFAQGTDFSQAAIILDSGYYLFCTLALGLVCSAAAYVMYFYSLQMAGVERANMVQNLIPLSAYVLSIFMLGESVTLQKTMGILLVIVSLFIFNMSMEQIQSFLGCKSKELRAS